MAWFTCQRRNLVNQRQKLSDIVSVGLTYQGGQRDASAISQKMMLAPFFAAIRGIGTRFLPPKTDLTKELSTTALDQSI